MQIIKGNNGFPYAWRAGRVEQLIINILERKAQEQLNIDRLMIVNPTWLHEVDIAKNIKEANPDLIICHNFVDPAVAKIFKTIETSGRPYIILGNANQYRLDFWAMVCDLYFQSYTDVDTVLKSTARKFICLNRKPHQHRKVIVDNLLPLHKQGYISLGTPGNPITIEEEFSDEQGIRDEYQNLGVERFVSNQIRNDIFSLGNLDVWNNSYLCLVTETEFSNFNPDNFFISEKTWKPIIGMRPFFVYGQAPLRQYLKDSGFDIFEDIFDYSNIDNSKNDPVQMQQYCQVAVDAVNQIKNPWQEYQTIRNRCQGNRDRFRSYVYEQWQRLEQLDLTNYL